MADLRGEITARQAIRGCLYLWTHGESNPVTRLKLDPATIAQKKDKWLR
jgi:hypothetical protein